MHGSCKRQEGTSYHPLSSHESSLFLALRPPWTWTPRRTQRFRSGSVAQEVAAATVLLGRQAKRTCSTPALVSLGVTSWAQRRGRGWVRFWIDVRVGEHSRTELFSSLVWCGVVWCCPPPTHEKMPGLGTLGPITAGGRESLLPSIFLSRDRGGVHCIAACCRHGSVTQTWGLRVPPLRVQRPLLPGAHGMGSVLRRCCMYRVLRPWFPTGSCWTAIGTPARVPATPISTASACENTKTPIPFSASRAWRTCGGKL